ncbi:MAG: acyltransferase, partial [Parachlamydiaceae bacterium]|nr:acyltransferase [Parachlamydiaceae bacterium]
MGYEDIEVCDNTIFGPYVVVVTANHSYANGSYFYGPPIDIKPVKIGSGSWISAHCTILPGADIAHGTLIAANSVFKGATNAGEIYGGVPARKIKKH